MISLDKNRYYKGILLKRMIPIYILLVATSILIIPLIILVLLYVGYLRQIQVNKSGMISIPGNIFNVKMPKNVYTFVSASRSSGPISPSSPSIAFYFDILNISDMYLVQNPIEKHKLQNRNRRVPSTMFVSDVDKTICIQFKVPLKFLDGFGRMDDTTSGHSKIYISLADPLKFIMDVKELVGSTAE